MEKTVVTLEELTEEAYRFKDMLAPLPAGATLITLSGELGAGKTAFTKAVAHALGVPDAVTSPTFVLQKVYTLPPSASFEKLIHIDAYRLKGKEELAPLMLEATLRDPMNIVMLEWPEQVVGGLPPAQVAITITANAEGSRTISYG